MSLKVDTIKLNNSGKRIVEISREIDDLINKLYLNIDCLNKYGYWQGESAKKYFDLISTDKEEFVRFNLTLKKYGEILVKYGNKFDSLANKYNNYD